MWKMFSYNSAILHNYGKDTYLIDLELVRENFSCNILAKTTIVKIRSLLLNQKNDKDACCGHIDLTLCSKPYTVVECNQDNKSCRIWKIRQNSQCAWIFSKLKRQIFWKWEILARYISITSPIHSESIPSSNK